MRIRQGAIRHFTIDLEGQTSSAQVGKMAGSLELLSSRQEKANTLLLILHFVTAPLRLYDKPRLGSFIIVCPGVFVGHHV